MGRPVQLTFWPGLQAGCCRRGVDEAVAVLEVQLGEEREPALDELIARLGGELGEVLDGLGGVLLVEAERIRLRGRSAVEEAALDKGDAGLNHRGDLGVAIIGVVGDEVDHPPSRVE